MSRTLIGICLKLLALFVLVSMVAVVKALTTTYPTGQIVFARSFFAIFPILALMAYQGELRSGLKTSRPRLHALRGVIGVTGMLCWFSALRFIPLPDATAISYAAPLFTTALAALLLGEVVRLYRWSAVFIGLIGVVIVLFPHLNGASDLTGDTALGAGLALVAAFFIALAIVQVRRMTATETTASIVFYFSIVGSVVGLATIPFGWQVPDLQGGLMLVLVGLMGGAGQILMTLSFRFAEASLLAPFDYSSMLWTLVIGVVIFDEIPTPTVLIGASVIIGAGIFVLLRERRLGIDRRIQNEVTTLPKA